MEDLKALRENIDKLRKEQIRIKQKICINIFQTLDHSMQRKVKIDNYVLKYKNIKGYDGYALYFKKKLILHWSPGFYNYYTARVYYFNTSRLLEMQDFNDKLVDYIKQKLLKIKEREENNAIDMIALKSLI